MCIECIECSDHFFGQIYIIRFDIDVTKIKNDKSNDTLAYEDNAHKVIVRTFSYFFKIATHGGQILSTFL